MIYGIPKMIEFNSQSLKKLVPQFFRNFAQKNRF